MFWTVFSVVAVVAGFYLIYQCRVSLKSRRMLARIRASKPHLEDIGHDHQYHWDFFLGNLAVHMTFHCGVCYISPPNGGCDMELTKFFNLSWLERFLFWWEMSKADANAAREVKESKRKELESQRQHFDRATYE